MANKFVTIVLLVAFADVSTDGLPGGLNGAALKKLGILNNLPTYNSTFLSAGLTMFFDHSATIHS